MYKVSVIIPAYNIEKYIERSVKSVLSQTLADIEIIIINDGSTDRTLDIINAIKDKKIKIINQENSGVSRAREQGIEIAEGEYLYFLDGDDWLENDALEYMYNVSSKRNLDILMVDAYIDDDMGNIDYLQGAKKISVDPLLDIMTDNVIPSLWSKFFKRDLFTKNSIIHPIDISMGEDLFLNIQLFYNASRIYRIEKAFLHYIIRPDSSTQQYSEKRFDIFKMLYEMKCFLINKSIYEKYKLEYEFLYYIHTYLYQVVFANAKGKVHKEIFSMCKKSINFTNHSNSYINQYHKKLSLIRKFLLVSYTSYNIGLILGNIYWKTKSLIHVMGIKKV
ncbi:glycosyltransferase family 2 protein [Gottfriedia acidiceleris]|uniref:glycosyltransferase family 2 protein n=1 Tax=Gottfriedia acidiceleris TaxID=371036 RepID=UPI0030000017